MSSIWKYKYFVDVIESKSFTKAGNMNYVSQTAISQNISSLEKMAGGKLVNRGKGEITPTELGRIVYRRAKEMLAVEKNGRLNVYVALLREENYADQQTRSFLDRVYGGNAGRLVSSLLKQDCLTAEDLDELKAFWEKGGKA